MKATVRVVGFAGSLRRGSYNKAALRAATEMLPAGVSLETVDLAPIPLYNGDLEAAGGLPQPVAEFKTRLAGADALLIVTPEYNYSVPGVLKNAIDWASRTGETSPLYRKPAAIMGRAAPSGRSARSSTCGSCCCTTALLLGLRDWTRRVGARPVLANVLSE